MNGRQKSEPPIVAVKPGNKAGRSAADPVERRGGAKENTARPDTHRTQRRASVPQGLDRVRQAAKARRTERFTALLHHVDTDLLRRSYLALKRDAAPGIDGVTWQDYGEDLEAKLVDLHSRVHRGAYRAQPSRRRMIPKPDGRQRPLGIAALEDKIVQRAVVEVLNAVYEEDFLGFSYGFRPGRSQHDALDALAAGIAHRKVNWILDADIRSFFDTVDHTWVLRFVEHRIGDQRILRLIRKWLKAGVMEAGVVTAREVGTPQGAVASPLLANIYLHYVFDLWANRWRQRAAHGEMIIVRYADDIVVGFQHQADALGFQADLRDRLEAFALSLHPDKTRVIEFGRFAARDRRRRGLGQPETFTFLGFTHICGQSRVGQFLLKRKSRRDRQAAKLGEIRDGLRRRMHWPLAEQRVWVRAVVQGYFTYHAVPTNFRSLTAFLWKVRWLWFRSLRRRSQKDGTTWKRFDRVTAVRLPKPRILHPWPQDRFAVKHPRWKPSAVVPHAGFCAGGAG